LKHLACSEKTCIRAGKGTEMTIGELKPTLTGLGRTRRNKPGSRWERVKKLAKAINGKGGSREECSFQALGATWKEGVTKGGEGKKQPVRSNMNVATGHTNKHNKKGGRGGERDGCGH